MTTKFTVIEDCSPYYIRFTFDDLPKIITFVKSNLDKLSTRYSSSYLHKDFPIDISSRIVSLFPTEFKFKFLLKRVSIFETPPCGGCGIHKDGVDHRVSFNIPIEINDSLCTTYWYDDHQFEGFDCSKNSLYTRNVYKDFNTMNKFTHSKSMIAAPGEMILFNTDIFHSWKNDSKEFSRKILTLRVENPGMLYFNDAKKILNLNTE